MEGALKQQTGKDCKVYGAMTNAIQSRLVKTVQEGVIKGESHSRCASDLGSACKNTQTKFHARNFLLLN